MNDDLVKAKEILLKGGVICYPTDTIWGLGCDACNAEAVSKIYAIKKRSDNKSMLILLDHEYRLDQYVKEVPDIVRQLIEVNDSPMTIIYDGAKNLASNLIASDGSIGIRITSDPFCKRLIELIRRPLVSTSANISGTPAPRYFKEINEEILNLADYVVKWRQDDNTPAKASSILRTGYNGEINILRK